jgi:hypothetical protein
MISALASDGFYILIIDPQPGHTTVGQEAIYTL